MPPNPPVDFVDPFTFQAIVCQEGLLVLLWPQNVSETPWPYYS